MKTQTFESYYNILNSFNKQLIDMYMIYLNDYCTVEGFAEYYEISVPMANCIIKEGKELRGNIIQLVG